MVERGKREEESFVWIGLFEPTDEEFDEVEELFDLHPLAVEDAVHAHQRPKLERYGDSSFLVMQTVGFGGGEDDDELDIGEVMIFLGDGFVVTVRHGAFSGLSDLRKRLEATPDTLAVGAGSVLHAVADRIVDEYAVVLIDLEEDVADIERHVFTPGRHDLAERIYRAKREVQTVRSAVSPLLEVARRLATDPPPLHVKPELAPYLRDVHDHVIRARERLAVLDELLSNALSANAAQVGLRQNEDMRRISAWVGIVAVPTMIAGVYGMNFEHMPELEWRYGYFLVLAVMFAISFGLYRAFKRSGWL
ncbi:MAG: magnesium/cobalt transporter CorA [Actinobacteria bacterium]|nr:magnesium/cobalt transporter CorA [Actinomycetota bacterium]